MMNGICGCRSSNAICVFLTNDRLNCSQQVFPISIGRSFPPPISGESIDFSYLCRPPSRRVKNQKSFGRLTVAKPRFLAPDCYETVVWFSGQNSGLSQSSKTVRTGAYFGTTRKAEIAVQSKSQLMFRFHSNFRFSFVS